jgi:hypothetical protein
MAQPWQPPATDPAFLIRRIDRCYLLAASARQPERRALHLERARHYRRLLTHTTTTTA